MDGNNRKRGINWGSLIGWLIFILVIAGGPILNQLGQLSGGTVTLPNNLLPLLIGGLVVLSIIVPAVRALGRSARPPSDPRLPTTLAPPPPNSAPMPPFGGPARPMQPPPPAPSPRAFTLPPSSKDVRLPSPPRFEPVINPTILLFGILGLIALGGLAVLVFVLNLP